MDGSVHEFDALPRVFAVDPGVDAVPLRRVHSARAAGSLPLVGVIRNPRSHRNRGHVPEMDGQPNVLNAVPGARGELPEILAGFAARGIDFLVVDGGDGTVRDVLTAGAPVFGHDWPPLIVLPKGKTNALAVDLGLPNHWSLPEALEAARGGRIVERCPVVVDQPGGDGGEAHGFILGAGIFNTATQAGQTAHRYGAFNNLAVALTAVSGMAQALFGIGRGDWRKRTPMRFYVGHDRAELAASRHGCDGERYSLLVSTLSRFPLGMQPFGKPRSGIRYSVIDAPLRRVVAMVPALLSGWETPGHERLGVFRGSTNEAWVEFGDRFILDGEAFPAGRYRLRMGPKLQFIAP